MCGRVIAPVASSWIFATSWVLVIALLAAAGRVESLRSHVAAHLTIASAAGWLVLFFIAIWSVVVDAAAAKGRALAMLVLPFVLLLLLWLAGCDLNVHGIVVIGVILVTFFSVLAGAALLLTLGVRGLRRR